MALHHQNMLDLPKTVECARCGLGVEVAGWHHCPVKRTDSVECFIVSFRSYLSRSKEARFFQYLIDTGRA